MDENYGFCFHPLNPCCGHLRWNKQDQLSLTSGLRTWLLLKQTEVLFSKAEFRP